MLKTEKETYEFQGQKLPVKVMDAPREAVDLLVWIEGLRKAREIEMQMWAEQASHVRQDIVQKLGLNSDEFYFDWDRMLTDGKVRYVDLSKAKKPVQVEEKQPGGESAEKSL